MRKCTTCKSSGMSDLHTEKNHKKQSLFHTITRLFSMIISSSPLAMVIQMLCSVTGGLLLVLVALLWKDILAKLGSDIATETYSFLILFVRLAIVGALSVSFVYISEIADTYFRNRISLNMQRYIHQKASRLPTLFYEIPALKDTVDRSQQAFCYGPAVGVAMSIMTIISSAISTISAAVLLYNFQPILASLVIFVTVPYLIKVSVNNKRIELETHMIPKRRQAEEYKGYFTKYECIKETQIWGLGNFFVDKLSQVLDDINEEETRANTQFIAIEFTLEAISKVGYTASILILGFLMSHGEIGVGEFGAVIYLLGEVNEKVVRFFDILTDLHEEILNVNIGFEFLDLPEELRKNQAALEPDSIDCNNVSFSYPMTQGKTVSGINLNIKKNEIIALVGLNGAGKTTISKLLLGLLPPGEGTIKYDSKDISNVEYPCIYHNVSVVFQDFNRYSLTIKENIALSSIQEQARPIQDYHEICESTGCKGWIDSLPEGYDTSLGKAYGGKELSGGQWQQLAITRAYFKSSNFVVLDEPSSALDPFNERLLYESFKTLCREKIGIIVTHRIGAASLADKILVVDDGQIVESGSHDELLCMRGKYFDLFSRQSMMYTETQQHT